MGLLMRIYSLAKLLYFYEGEYSLQLFSFSRKNIINSVAIERRSLIPDKNLFLDPLLQQIPGPCIFVARVRITGHGVARIDADDIIGALPVKSFLVIRCYYIVRRRGYVIA